MCDCIEKCNADLAQSEFPNTMIEYPLWGPKMTFVVTCKRDEKVRQKPKRLFASYCPFCGEKYTDAALHVKAMLGEAPR